MFHREIKFHLALLRNRCAIPLLAFFDGLGCILGFVDRRVALLLSAFFFEYTDGSSM